MSLAASIISSTLNAGTPLLIAAVGIIIHEKSGVLNLGIEGIMLMGAVSGFAVTHATGSFELGFLAGMGVGLLLGLLFAFFTIGLRANQRDLRQAQLDDLRRRFNGARLGALSQHDVLDVGGSLRSDFVNDRHL